MIATCLSSLKCENILYRHSVKVCYYDGRFNVFLNPTFPTVSLMFFSIFFFSSFLRLSQDLSFTNLLTNKNTSKPWQTCLSHTYMTCRVATGSFYLLPGHAIFSTRDHKSRITSCFKGVKGESKNML